VLPRPEPGKLRLSSLDRSDGESWEARCLCDLWIWITAAKRSEARTIKR